MGGNIGLCGFKGIPLTSHLWGGELELAGPSFVCGPRRAMWMLSCWVGAGLSCAGPSQDPRLVATLCGGWQHRGTASHCSLGQRQPHPQLAAHEASQTQLPAPQVHSQRPFEIAGAFIIGSRASPMAVRVDHTTALLPAGWRCATAARTDLQNQDKEGWSSEEREWDCEQRVLGSRSGSALYVPLSESPSLSRGRD